jgi:hypothetical protein
MYKNARFYIFYRLKFINYIPKIYYFLRKKNSPVFHLICNFTKIIKDLLPSKISLSVSFLRFLIFTSFSPLKMLTVYCALCILFTTKYHKLSF